MQLSEYPSKSVFVSALIVCMHRVCARMYRVYVCVHELCVNVSCVCVYIRISSV